MQTTDVVSPRVSDTILRLFYYNSFFPFFFLLLVLVLTDEGIVDTRIATVYR